MITTLLQFCLVLRWVVVLANLAILAIPPVRGELAIWRNLRINLLRHRLTRQRRLPAPLVPPITYRKAKASVFSHACMACALFFPIADAARLPAAWWRTLIVVFLTVCNLALLAGSFVQRQKMAILRLHGAVSGPSLAPTV